MTAQEIRQKYLDFYAARGHVVIPRALLVPQNDPSTLFTGSGMQPMIPYLLGEAHQDGKRLVNSQVCLRAQDIDDIGDDKHTTSFEMLGNWSLGDYYKTEQIQWIAEFLFDVVGLDPARVYVSCYIGNKKYNIPRDVDAIALWQAEFAKRSIEASVVELGAASEGGRLGMQGGRIFLYDGRENWWSRNGNEDGTLAGDPCGPDSEMFYDFGERYHDESKWGKAHPASDSPRFFEIGNNVFMGYRKIVDAQGIPSFEKLASPNIDHGSGLERIAAAALDNPDVYKISLLKPIIDKLESISGKNYESHTESMRVIADHLRGATFLAVDGVVPSNKAQGYVMRRLMRRAMVKAFDLGIEQNFVQEIVPVVATMYIDDFPDMRAKRDEVIAVLIKEERAFRNTLRKGLHELNRISNLPKYPVERDGAYYERLPASESEGSRKPPKTVTISAIGKPFLDGGDIFMLKDTYGFPEDLSIEQATILGILHAEDWKNSFDELMQQQKDRSRTATKGDFKGGLGGQTLQHKKYHTATHLMYQALRIILGDHVVQRGSNITEERLRFDFSHDDKLTAEQILAVEKIVNRQIDNDLIVFWKEYPTQSALSMGALGAFGDRYGDTVKIYQMGGTKNVELSEGGTVEDAERFSFEICGGPHVDHTGELAEPNVPGGASKIFKILKEESSSAGIRRIKAVLH